MERYVSLPTFKNGGGSLMLTVTHKPKFIRPFILIHLQKDLCCPPAKTRVCWGDETSLSPQRGEQVKQYELVEQYAICPGHTLGRSPAPCDPAEEGRSPLSPVKLRAGRSDVALMLE